MLSPAQRPTVHHRERQARIQDTVVRLIKRVLPRGLKAATRAGLRELALHRNVRHAVRQPTLLADAAFLADIRSAWGNTGYSADVAFLSEMVLRVRTSPGPVLECGSGISTILMGLAAPPATEIWTLENDAGWVTRVHRVLRHHGLRSVRALQAPLKSYGDFAWYDPPLQLMPSFPLIICDGPAEATPGGRYAVFSVMRSHLAENTVLLLDDADTPASRAVLSRWQIEEKAQVELRESAAGTFAVVSIRTQS